MLTLDQALAALLAVLETHLPAEVPGLPPHNVTAVRIGEKLGGLGRLAGAEARGLGEVALRSRRLEGELRFQLWSDSAGGADDAILALQMNLLAAEDALRGAGFLRFSASGATLAEAVPILPAWRKTASFEVLYEAISEDAGGAESLIVRIPVGGGLDGTPPAPVAFEERGSLVRWDDEGSAPLVARGRRRLARLAALTFVPGLSPAGPVTLLRTFDGAVGPAVPLPTPADFFAAIGGEAPAARHARLEFPSLADFLAAFMPESAAIPLGDWNLDAVPDLYQPSVLPIEPVLHLPTAADRFEVRPADADLSAPAVVYLRLE